MNVLIYRLPKGLSIIYPMSYCPYCNKSIKWYDNIPLLSYIILKGKCRNCKNKISYFYFIVEIATSIIFVLLYLKYGLTLNFIKYAIFSFLLLSSSFTDIKTLVSKEYETGVIPEVYTVIGVIVAFVFSIYNNNFINFLAGWATGFLILYIPAYFYSIIRKIKGIGEGDFLLFAMIGGFLGYNSIGFILSISAILGVIIGIFVIIRTKNKNFPIPFAPMLSGGSLIYLFTDNMLQNTFWQRCHIKIFS